MNKNIWIRVLAGIGGVVLAAMGLCALAETFFHVPVTAGMGNLLGAGTPLAVLAALLLAIALCTCGVCCLLALTPKRAAKRSGFVMQKGETGMIGVSVKSIEGLVQTCVKQHDVVSSAEISVVERRDGIVILLDIKEAAGVNIPLAVGALQKQIKQYVTDCTGVDVREVRVLVDNTDEDAPLSPYTVKSAAVLASVRPAEIAAPVETAPVYAAPAEETVPVEVEAAVEDEAPVEELAAEETPVMELPVVQMPPIPPMPVMEEEEDDRPLHQRLFGAEEQPVFVPAPPVMIAEEAVEETPVEEDPIEAEEPAEETGIAEEVDPNAVLEVVAAIAQEEALLMDEADAEPVEESTEEAADEENEKEI